jgi:hypothetical protein
MSINSQTIRTVGTAGNYATLTTAFTDINNGVITGNIELQIISSYTVASTATLNPSGTGSASYTAISIYPTGVGGYSIQHNIAGNGISLLGADNVTIDGRVNRTGSTRSLTILNNNTGTSTSTINLQNSAENNKIRWCIIRGSTTSTSRGIIHFASATAGNSNDGNRIDNCDITNNAGARARHAIYSVGTSGFSNDNDTISNCNIFDFANVGTTTSGNTGINIANFSSNWVINANNFYETGTWTSAATANSSLTCIAIGPVGGPTAVGTNWTITNNNMGGSASNGTGTWTINNSTFATAFMGIFVKSLSGGTTSIHGNTIKNITINTRLHTFMYPFIGVKVGSTGSTGVGGNLNVGSTSGNTIENISVTSTSTTNPLWARTFGIDLGETSAAFGNVRIENNIIRGITAASSGNYIHSIFGINLQETSNTFYDLTISNNTIGSSTVANSINATSTCANGSTNAQSVAGIYLGTGNNANYNTTISGNTIANLRNGATATTATHTLHGIFYNGRLTTGTNLVTRNFIHSIIPVGTTCNVWGILTSSTPGNTTYSNNIISLGTGITVATNIYGLNIFYATASENAKVYHNTIYIGGGNTTNTAGTSFAFRGENINSAAGNDFRNNILMNARSGQSLSASKHYAIRFASGSFAASHTANYNDYWVSGTNGVFAMFGFGDVTTLSSWKTSTGQEANTINTNPTFASAGGTSAANYLPSATVNGLSGISGAPTIDHFQNTRPSTPKMGALESSCNPPNGTVAFGAFTSVGSSSITVNTTFTNGTNLANGYVLLRNTTNTAPTAPTSGTAVPSTGNTSFVSGYTVVGSSTTLGSSVAFVSSGLASGTTYYYWVIPYQNTGGPCWLTTSTQTSNSQTTTAPPSCAPPNGTVSFGSFTNIDYNTTTANVTYTNGANAATGYILLRNTTNVSPIAPSSGTALPIAGSTTFITGYTVVNLTTTIGSSVAFPNTGLSLNTTYYYWVMAYQNSNGPCYFTPTTQNNNSQTTLVSGLPIELVSFTAECNEDRSRLFKWQTASEHNNDFFTIEESTDNINWDTIHTIDGAGNSTGLLDYSYIYRPKVSNLDSLQYYRLKQTDFDGGYEYSGIISLFCKNNEWVSHFITPSQNNIIIGFINSPIKTTANIQLYSETGQLIAQTNIPLKDGSNLINIDNLSLSDGMYLVRLNADDQTFIHKIIVVN